MAVLLAVLTTAGRAEWGGGISASAAETYADTTRNASLDQNYDFHVSNRLLPQLRYTGTLRYRLLHMEAEGMAPMRQTEIQPTLSATWSNPAYSLRSNYIYRSHKDDRNTLDFSGQSVSLFFQTNIARLPRVQGRYEWTRNINDLDLLGRDTRLRLYSLGTSHSVRQTSVSYNVTNSLTRNPTTGLERTETRHTGRLDNMLKFFRKAASIQTSYQVVDRSEREVQASNQQPLLPVAAVAGLYLEDPSPELGTLESLPALIDGVTTAPVSPEISLSGTEFHNFGLDFGAAVSVDYLFLSTDTLAYPDLRWAVYASDDNLAWQLVKGFERSTFSTVFNRYELSFPRQTVRYIKLVLEPLQQTTPVYPTELRALVAHDDTNEPDHSTDHHGNVELRVRPAEWLQASVAADVVRTKGSLSTLAREQDGLRGSLRVQAASWAMLSGNYQATRSRYPQSTQERNEGQVVSVALESQWLPTLSTRGVISRSEERLDDIQSRRSTSHNFRAQMQWLPGLAGISEFGYIEDVRPSSGDKLFTRLVGQTVEAQPISPVTAFVNYRHYALEARRTAVPAYRETVDLRVIWRVSQTLVVNGDEQIFHEPNRRTRSENVHASWNPTEKWALSSGWSRADADENGGSTLLSLSAIFRWTSRTEFSFAYYHTRYDDATQSGISSARLGFNTRF